MRDSYYLTCPSFHVDLAPLDARHPIHYGRRLLIFRCASNEQCDAQMAALQDGLKALVAQCHILAGENVPLRPKEGRNGNEDWPTIVPDGLGLEMVVRNLSNELPSFEELEASNFSPVHLPYDELVPIPADLNLERPFAACKVQLSFITGGTILTFSNSHSVADGGGIAELLRILAEETRLAHLVIEQEHDHSPSTGQVQPAASNKNSAHPAIGLDRSKLRNITSPIPFRMDDHPAFTPVDTRSADFHSSSSSSRHPFEASAPEIPVLLHISAANLAQLKADASPVDPKAPRISTHDALSALLWRTVLVIRSRRSGLSKEQLSSTNSSLYLPSDARDHLGLAPSYIGNAVYQLTASLDLGTLLSESGLKHAASALRAAILAVKPELVASYMTRLREKWMGWGFMTAYASTGAAMGTGWGMERVYGFDWGEAFGPLVAYREPGSGGYNEIYPKRPDGSAEIVVGVMPEEVDLLKGPEGFGKYLGN